MPTREPNHYWPAELDQPEPAKEAAPEALPGRHLTPFEMTDGSGAATGGRRFLFETKFYDTPSDVEPDPKAQTVPAVNPETIRKSLGE